MFKHPIKVLTHPQIKLTEDLVYFVFWRHLSNLKFLVSELITYHNKTTYIVSHPNLNKEKFSITYSNKIGFSGLEVACWPLVPKFTGSNPAEAVGFLRAKKSSARLPSEGK